MMQVYRSGTKRQRHEKNETVLTINSVKQPVGLTPCLEMLAPNVSGFYEGDRPSNWKILIEPLEAGQLIGQMIEAIVKKPNEQYFEALSPHLTALVNVAAKCATYRDSVEK